ncbi:hypothetical protein NEOLEDRAFT_1162040 [Neolentinus lepideus HHB14362 ss-1]|uniref:Sister chromatid cohesion protein Dcc1 n=1 Tax=Neolentinus lepideus HHB14362 ss-1 TaxID=1314782 RepID=A0A165TJZ8_9AGAM|nr:hypothetical protein NEOLEDRAFT_1162040 [Neolentinus lepideus HHB14362 ss-1]
MSETEVVFSYSSADAGTFKLLELPPDLLKLVEAAMEGSHSLSLSVKGGPEEDAVLCTDDKTYTMRSVVLSNSVLVVTPPKPEQEQTDGIVIRDQLHDVIELVPSLPKLHKLKGVLRGTEYDETHEDEEMMDADEQTENSSLPRKFTYTDAMQLQASEGELRRGLRDMRILDIGGRLRPISPSYLNMILELILNYLVSESLPHDAVPVDQLVSALEDDHEIRRQVTLQVLTWFGVIDGSIWEINVEEVLKQVALGILRHYKDEAIAEDEFIARWKRAVGDAFEAKVSLKLLEGNYLSTTLPNRFPAVLALLYFPSSSLPIDPAARFTDLFLTRLKWKAQDIAPYLADIAVDAKERDKLLLKYARATTDAEGVWYTSRNKI